MDEGEEEPGERDKVMMDMEVEDENSENVQEPGKRVSILGRDFERFQYNMDTIKRDKAKITGDKNKVGETGDKKTAKRSSAEIEKEQNKRRVVNNEITKKEFLKISQRSSEERELDGKYEEQKETETERKDKSNTDAKKEDRFTRVNGKFVEVSENKER